MVPLAARYTAAWSEINFRAQLRQVTINQFTAIVFGYLTLLASFVRGPFLIGDTPGRIPLAVYVTLCLALPLVGLGCSYWVSYHSMRLRLLSAFCMACEEETERTVGALPSFHTQSQGWDAVITRHREKSNRVFLVLVLFTSAPSLYLLFINDSLSNMFVRWTILFISLSICAAIVRGLISIARRMDIEPLKKSHDSYHWERDKAYVSKDDNHEVKLPPMEFYSRSQLYLLITALGFMFAGLLMFFSRLATFEAIFASNATPFVIMIATGIGSVVITASSIFINIGASIERRHIIHNLRYDKGKARVMYIKSVQEEMLGAKAKKPVTAAASIEQKSDIGS